MPESLQEFLQNIKPENFVVFIGSGLSVNYPSWVDLIEQLCKNCGIQYPEPEDINADKLMDLADGCHKNNPNIYNKTLKNIFAKPITSTIKNYEYLINIPFRCYVTTNFDPLLAVQSEQIKSDVNTQRIALDPTRLERNVFYIHGYIKEDGDVKDEQLVLSKSDFKREYHDKDKIKMFLKPVLQFNSVLFIGCSLEEPELRELINICNDARKEAKNERNIKLKKHYILLPPEKTTVGMNNDKELAKQVNDEKIKNTDRFYEDLGITVIRYAKGREDLPYYGLQELLKEMSDLRKAEVTDPYEEENLEL